VRGEPSPAPPAFSVIGRSGSHLAKGLLKKDVELSRHRVLFPTHRYVLPVENGRPGPTPIFIVDFTDITVEFTD
jgi:hypothetical protein